MASFPHKHISIPCSMIIYLTKSTYLKMKKSVKVFVVAPSSDSAMYLLTDKRNLCMNSGVGS